MITFLTSSALAADDQTVIIEHKNLYLSYPRLQMG